MSDDQPVHESQVIRSAVMLVLLQSLTIGWLLSSVAFAVGTACVALAALLPLPRCPLERAPGRGWYLLLAMVFFVKFRIAPDSVPQEATVLSSIIAIELSRFLILVQLAQLFIHYPPGRFPVWFSGLATVSMIFACDSRLTLERRGQTIWLAFAFVVALAIFSASTRRYQPGGKLSPLRLLMILLTLGTAAFTARITSVAWHQYEHAIDRWVIDHLGGGQQNQVSPGFSGRGELGEISGWKQHAAEHIALRAFSEQSPGYLRGRVFDSYRDNRWFVQEDVAGLNPTRQPPFAPVRSQDKVYPLGEAVPATAAAKAGVIDVWPDENNRAHIFLPLETVAVAITSEHVTINSHRVLSRSEVDAAPYTIFQMIDSSTEPLSGEMLAQCLAVPSAIGEEVHQIADSLFVGHPTTAEKIARIKTYFAQNHQYSLQAQRSIGVDAITEFLATRRPGHCEYFAASGAMLLRLGGVPTRYTTGYVCSEYNPTGGYWVARRKDAHAWIEAFDNDLNRWIVVECTPSNGVPGEASLAGTSDWWDALLFRTQHLIDSSTSIGWGGMVLWIGSIVLSLPAVILYVALGTMWFLRRRRQRTRSQPVWSLPERREFTELLQLVDRTASQFGFQRLPHETLIAFADRIQSNEAATHASDETFSKSTTLEEQATDRSAGNFTSRLANWYLRYADLRYRPPQQHSSLFEELTQSAGTLKQSRKNSIWMTSSR